MIPTKEIAELLDTVSDKLPKLANGIISTLYSAQAGKSMGEGVGNFYKSLLDAGIPPQEALNMSKEYMLSIKDITEIFKSGNAENDK